MKIVIATIKSWNIEKAKKLKEQMKGKHDITILTAKEEFTMETLDAIKPEIVLLPHWSYIIPEKLFEKYPCVIFHMTDLPYGRGGSPLQNLIVRGKKETMLSAIQVTAELKQYMHLLLLVTARQKPLVQLQECRKMILQVKNISRRRLKTCFNW